MNGISLKKVGLLFLALLIVAHTGKIVHFFENLSLDDHLAGALEPLGNSPPLAKMTLVLLLFGLFYITIYKLLMAFFSTRRTSHSNSPIMMRPPQNISGKQIDNGSAGGGLPVNKSNKKAKEG